jgi:hypothetical protein
MLDKNISWSTLSGPDGTWLNLTKLATACQQLHRKKQLPDYTLFQSELPDHTLFRAATRSESAGGLEPDPTQEMLVAQYPNHTPEAGWVRRVHGLDYCHVKMHRQPVGRVVKNHFDYNGTMFQDHQRDHPGRDFGTQDVVKVVHFLTDWRVGQVFMFGRQAVTGWRAGEALTFPWYMEHSTANASEDHQRELLFIAGVRWPRPL